MFNLKVLCTDKSFDLYLVFFLIWRLFFGLARGQILTEFSPQITVFNKTWEMRHWWNIYSERLWNDKWIFIIILVSIKDYVYSGFKLSKIFVQNLQTLEVKKKCFKTKNKNAINKYQYWYLCFVYLRKICYTKGRLIFDIQMKFELIFFSS